MYTTFIFDLDGTLLNTLPDLAAAVNHALTRHALPALPLDSVRRLLGNGVRRLVSGAIDEAGAAAGIEKPGEEVCEEIFQTFRAFYLDHSADRTAPYAGIPAVVEELRRRGLRVAIVSNKLQPAVTDLNLRYFGNLIPVAIGEAPGVRRKPAPDSVLRALELLGSSKDEAVYIGDSEVDYATALAAGLPYLIVTWGFRTKEELAATGAQCFIDRPEQILGFAANALP